MSTHFYGGAKKFARVTPPVRTPGCRPEQDPHFKRATATEQNFSLSKKC